MNSPIRINKALAQAGVCSRRQADELVTQGRVLVNNAPLLTPGTRIDMEKDIVHVDGRRIDLCPAQKSSPLYLMINKPVQVVCTVKDPEGRTTVLDILPEPYSRHRLFPVGRLDYFSEGLLILTNDGELTHRMTHPRYHLEKVYFVRLREEPAEEALATMRRGMRLAEGKKLAPVEVEQLSNKHLLRMTLMQGVNRQIRRMCRDLGLTILTLRRVQIGKLELGDLAPGQCRELTAEEIRALHHAVGYDVGKI
jgi:pseudouridine synthase